VIRPADIRKCEREASTTGAENFGLKIGVKIGFKKDPKDNTGISPDYVRQKLIVVISHSYECVIIYTLELYYKQIFEHVQLVIIAYSVPQN
jgi:hypothetical protein